MDGSRIPSRSCVYNPIGCLGLWSTRLGAYYTRSIAIPRRFTAEPIPSSKNGISNGVSRELLRRNVSKAFDISESNKMSNSNSSYSIVRTCWADDPHARPPFKHLAAQWERLLGNNARYIELENTAFSNPLYCGSSVATTTTSIADAVSDVSAATLEVDQQLDQLDHLWQPPRTSDHGIHTPDQKHIPAGYDVPRPLIETKTIEQNLRYENDLRATPMNIRNLVAGLTKETTTTSPRASETSSLVDNGEYDTPVKHRVKTYLDMTRTSRNGSIGYNLDVQNVDKQNLSKDVRFRFRSELNLSQSVTTPL